MAIGAGRSGLIRQLMTESLLIAIGGGVAGLVVGYASVENEASHALCRRIGFELRGTGVFPSDDGDMAVTVWVFEAGARA